MSEALVDVLRAQQRGCAIGGSPFYAGLLDHVIADVEAGGPCLAALAEVAVEPRRQAGVLRVLRSVHELVLDGSAPELAAHYPSAGGRPGRDLSTLFRDAVAAHLDRIIASARRPLQTNEVGRSAALVGGFLELARGPGAGLGGRLRVLEVGASAGLNLWWDRFRYEHGATGWGPVGSGVRIVGPWGPSGPTPDLGVQAQVVERRGCDRSPLDPADPADRLLLRASVWPDQPERRARLDAALAIAVAAGPAPVDRADARRWVRERLATPTPGAVSVVAHAIVLQYLDPASRAELRDVIADAGARATPDAPVAWLRMEPASAAEAEVRLRCWPDPEGRGDVVLARAGFHGLPVRWWPPVARDAGGGARPPG